jgi:hypothetical protein
VVKGGIEICSMCYRIVSFMCCSVHDKAIVIKRLGVMTSHLNLTEGLYHVKREIKSVRIVS